MKITKIGSLIYDVRGQRIMLDSDLAVLYGVKTKELNKAVGRNRGRFPNDFMFRLSSEESRSLRFQFGTSKKGRGGRRFLPFAFTEQGVAMLSGVLNSDRAIQVNIAIMRAFVHLRRGLMAGGDLATRVRSAEYVIAEHDRELTEHAAHINQAFAEIRRITKP